MHGKLERMKCAPNELRRTFSSLMPTKRNKKNVREDENAKPYFDAKCIFRNIRGVAIRCISVPRAISYHAPSPGENAKWNKRLHQKLLREACWSVCIHCDAREKEKRDRFLERYMALVWIQENRILVNQRQEVFTLRVWRQISKLKIEEQQLSKINIGGGHTHTYRGSVFALLRKLRNCQPEKQRNVFPRNLLFSIYLFSLVFLVAAAFVVSIKI